ncbi:hypothetical protein Lal_00044297 [Lupinus albus]|nr:hypothetical protein Lal_00044297 [Lupinus albus]
MERRGLLRRIRQIFGSFDHPWLCNLDSVTKYFTLCPCAKRKAQNGYNLLSRSVAAHIRG